VAADTYPLVADVHAWRSMTDHDEGSAGFHTHHNVVDHPPQASKHPPSAPSAWFSSTWFHANIGARDIRVDHIWTNQHASGDDIAAHKLVNVTLAEIYNVSGEHFPAAAREIMKQAGVRRLRD
jgi:hypothetical protein